MTQWFALWALYVGVPGSIPDSTNFENELFYIGSGKVFEVVLQSKIRCSDIHGTGNYLVHSLAYYYYSSILMFSMKINTKLTSNRINSEVKNLFNALISTITSTNNKTT